jgi:class 3 adenylate cyclase
MELRMQYATTSDGVRIAFGTAGSGPCIIRIPSPPFSHSQLEWSQGSDFFDQLAANWTIVQYDPRGCGLSDRDVTDLSFEARMLDLKAVVEKLGLETFALHGIGWSGPLAITYAVRHPERATHLILDDTQARTVDFFNVPQIRALDALTGDWDSFLEFLVFSSFGLGRSEAGPHIAYFKACVTQSGALSIFEASRSDDATDLLPEVTQPTLITQHGGVGGRVGSGARDMASLIPGARLVVLEGLALDENEKIVQAIGDLLGTAPALDARRTALPAAATASGVRTILFTDIVGHTEMMHRLGDRAGRDVLREHEELTRKTLQAHGGEEVKSMGDGFMASFASVTGAVECAIALQRAFEERHHGPGADSGSEPVHIRIGLNAGEPIEEGGDLFGSTVIMASRIAAQAGGGEILTSDVVRGLCSGKGFLFADRGENVLRGFEDPMRLYEVRWRD